MINKVREYIHKYSMFQEGDRVVLAVSGGADSVALLCVMNRLKEELRVQLFVAHLNHGLRGRESDDDSEWVKRKAEDLGLPFLSKKVNIAERSNDVGLSLEDAARKERYAFFHQLLKDLPADKIALGHQFHDQAETVTLNFLRGAGSRGLRGILPVRDQIFVRPLLGLKKHEILTYLKKEETDYREDESNRSVIFLRNRVRHELLPHLKEFNPKIEERLQCLAETMRVENAFLEEQTKAILDQWRFDLHEEEIRIPLDKFHVLHEAIQRRIIKAILESRCGERNGIGQVHINAIMELAGKGHVEQRLSLPFATLVIRSYDDLLFKRQIRRRPNEPNGKIFQYPQTGSYVYAVKKIPDEVLVKEAGMRMRFTETEPGCLDFSLPTVAYLDYDSIEFPIEIRDVRDGDRFCSLGMAGTKKVKSFFIDRKIPRASRHQIPLVVDRKHILWIAGLAMSDMVKVRTSTRTCLKIEII